MDAPKLKKRGIMLLFVWGALEVCWVGLYAFGHETQTAFLLGSVTSLLGAAQAAAMIRKARREAKK